MWFSLACHTVALSVSNFDLRGSPRGQISGDFCGFPLLVTRGRCLFQILIYRTVCGGRKASLREGGGPLAVEGACENATISILKNLNRIVEKKLIQLRIFYDNNLYAYAGSFHHFVVPLPPGGRLPTLSNSPQFGRSPAQTNTRLNIKYSKEKAKIQ